MYFCSMDDYDEVQTAMLKALPALFMLLFHLVRYCIILAWFVLRRWGYLVLALAIYGYFFTRPQILGTIIAESLAALGYFLFLVRVPCGFAIEENQWCVRPSHGLLLGCSQHAWQYVKQLFTATGARAIRRKSQSITGALGWIGGALAVIQALVAAITLAFR
jgi:hypothetical protein